LSSARTWQWSYDKEGRVVTQTDPLGKVTTYTNDALGRVLSVTDPLGKVYTFGPTFRAENSNTPRHAAEFTSVDVELSWIDSHDDVMRMEEVWLRHVLSTVQREHREAI